MLYEILNSPLFNEDVLSKIDKLHKFILAEGIWQHKLLKTSPFAIKMQGYGISTSHVGEDLCLFAKYGIIKADGVGLSLDSDQQYDFLLPIEQYNGYKAYLFKNIKDTSEIDLTYLYLLDEKNEQPMTCYFHPYRIYGVNHLFNLAKRNIVSEQPFLDINGLKRLNKTDAEEIESYLKSDNIWKEIRFYNTLIDLCILSEVAFHSYIFQKISYPSSRTYEDILELIDKLKISLKSVYKAIGLETIELLRSYFVRKIKDEDPNITVHALLRMMKPEERLRLKGKLGLSMLFVEMSEVLRRAAEFYFETELCEENKVRGEWYFDDFMKGQFGTTRILDEPIAKTEFIRFLGLDYTLRAKIYVEGYTEYGFLEEFFSDIHAIQIINLEGQFDKGKRKGLTFSENLQEDQRLHLFSFVLMDKEPESNVHLLTEAVLNDDFFGMFFISKPDFECENFSSIELYTAFCNHYNIEENPELKFNIDSIESGNDFFSIINKFHDPKFGIRLVSDQDFQFGNFFPANLYTAFCNHHNFEENSKFKADSVKSGKDFLTIVRDLHSDQKFSMPKKFNKSEEWGKALAKFAYESDINRPLLQFVRRIMTSLDCGYEWHQQMHKVDLDSGLLIEKPS